MIVKNNYNIKKRKYEESDNEDDNPHNKKKFITKNKKYKYKKQRKGYKLLKKSDIKKSNIQKSNIKKSNIQKSNIKKSVSQYGGRKEKKEKKVKEKKDKILKEDSTHRKIKKKATLETTRKRIRSSFSRKGKQLRTYTTFSAKKRNQIRGEREAKRFGIQRKQKEANELKAKMIMYPKNSKKYKKLKEEYLKVKTSLNLKKAKKRKKDKESTSGFGKRSANKNEKKLMKNIKSINSLTNLSSKAKKEQKIKRTGALLQKQSRYLQESTKNGDVFVDKNGKIISTEEMIADENYKSKLSTYISGKPDAKPYEIKNQLLRISRQNMKNKNYESEQKKYDLKKASETLTEAHERKGRQKLTEIELESKQKIKKNEEAFDKTINELKNKYNIDLSDNEKKNFKTDPKKLQTYLNNSNGISYEDKDKLKENIRKIAKHKGIVESSQKKQKFLDNKISKKMSNRVEQKTNNIEAKEKSLKEIEEELKETKLGEKENKEWYELRNKSISVKRYYMSNQEKEKFEELTEKRKLAEKLNKEKKLLEADIGKRKAGLSQEKTELIKANRIRVSQLKQKKETGDNNAKIQSHIKSLTNNSDKTEFEEFKRKYDAAPEEAIIFSKEIFKKGLKREKTKDEILKEFKNKNKDSIFKDIDPKKMDAEKEADKKIKEIENKNKEINESKKELKELELAEKKLKEKSNEEKQLMEILETKKNELEGLPFDDENEKQSKISDIEEKQKVLALSQKDTKDKIEELNSKKKRETNQHRLKTYRKQTILNKLKNENLPEYTKNKISKIKSDDEKKKKSERVDETLRFEVKEELKDKIEKEIENNEDFKLDKGKLMTDKAILDKLNTDPEYKNNPNMDDLKKHYQRKINLQSNPDLQKKVALEVFDNREVTKAEIDKINELYGIELNKDKVELEKIKQLSDDDKKNKFNNNNEGKKKLDKYLTDTRLNEGTKAYYDEKEKFKNLSDEEIKKKEESEQKYIEKKIQQIKDDKDKKKRNNAATHIQSAFREMKEKKKIKKKEQIETKIKAIKELKDELKEGKVDTKEFNIRLEKISQDINNSNNNNSINKKIEYGEQMEKLLNIKNKSKKKMLNAEIKKKVIEKLLQNNNSDITKEDKEILLKTFNNLKELDANIKKKTGKLSKNNSNNIIAKTNRLKKKFNLSNEKFIELGKNFDKKKTNIETQMLNAKLEVIKDRKIAEKLGKNDSKIKALDDIRKQYTDNQYKNMSNIELYKRIKNNENYKNLYKKSKKKHKNQTNFNRKIKKQTQRYETGSPLKKKIKKITSITGKVKNYDLGKISSKIENLETNPTINNENKQKKIKTLEKNIDTQISKLETVRNVFGRKEQSGLDTDQAISSSNPIIRQRARRIEFLKKEKEKLNKLKSITLYTNQNTKLNLNQNINLNNESQVGGNISKNKINFINKLHSKEEKNKNKKNKKKIKPYKNISKSLKKKINVNKKSNKVYQYINKNKKSKKQLLRNKYKKLSKKIYL